MRIWIVNQYAVPPTQPGGTRHYTLARELIHRGHEVTVIASSFHYALRTETYFHSGQAWARQAIQGVPFVWLRTPPYTGNTGARVWNMLVFAVRLWACARKWALQRPDVIVGSSPHLFAALAAERLARRYRIPFVLEVRDLWPQTFLTVGNFSRYHPAIQGLEWLERYLYRRADRILTLLPAAVEHITKKGARRDVVVWLPNGVDLRLVPLPQPPPVRNVLTVMYAGAHGLANNLGSVLDAAAILQRDGWQSRVRVRFVGDGPEKARLQRRAQDEGITLVRFDLPVPKNQVYAVLQEADAFIHATRNIKLYRYGFSPNKLYDYLAVARPVIDAAVSFRSPVADSGGGLTISPDDASAMADAIKQLAEMPLAQRWEMGLRGRRYVEEHHDFQRLAAKFERVLHEVTAPKYAYARF